MWTRFVLLAAFFCLSQPVWAGKPSIEVQPYTRSFEGKEDTVFVAFMPECIAQLCTNQEQTMERAWVQTMLKRQSKKEITIVVMIVANTVTARTDFMVDNGRYEFLAVRKKRHIKSLGIFDSVLVVRPGEQTYAYLVFEGKIKFSEKDQFYFREKPGHRPRRVTWLNSHTTDSVITSGYSSIGGSK